MRACVMLSQSVGVVTIARSTIRLPGNRHIGPHGDFTQTAQDVGLIRPLGKVRLKRVGIILRGTTQGLHGPGLVAVGLEVVVC